MESPVLLSLASKGTIAKASSVLQRNVKLYGPMNALDTDNSTSSWNSDGTADTSSSSSTGPQSCWFIVDFRRPVRISELKIQFQAGFCAESCSLYQSCTRKEVATAEEISPSWDLVDDAIEWEDKHEIQSCSLSDNSCSRESSVGAIKLIFNDMTDFYERVIIYRLEVWGHEIE